MNNLYVFPFILCISCSSVFAQGEAEETAATGTYQLFQKGSFTTNLLPNISYDHRTNTPENGNEWATNTTNYEVIYSFRTFI